MLIVIKKSASKVQIFSFPVKPFSFFVVLLVKSVFIGFKVWLVTAGVVPGRPFFNLLI